MEKGSGLPLSGIIEQHLRHDGTDLMKQTSATRQLSSLEHSQQPLSLLQQQLEQRLQWHGKKPLSLNKNQCFPEKQYTNTIDVPVVPVGSSEPYVGYRSSHNPESAHIAPHPLVKKQQYAPSYSHHTAAYLYSTAAYSQDAAAHSQDTAAYSQNTAGDIRHSPDVQDEIRSQRPVLSVWNETPGSKFSTCPSSAHVPSTQPTPTATAVSRAVTNSPSSLSSCVTSQGYPGASSSVTVSHGDPSVYTMTQPGLHPSTKPGVHPSTLSTPPLSTTRETRPVTHRYSLVKPGDPQVTLREPPPAHQSQFTSSDSSFHQYSSLQHGMSPWVPLHNADTNHMIPGVNITKQACHGQLCHKQPLISPWAVDPQMVHESASKFLRPAPAHQHNTVYDRVLHRAPHQPVYPTRDHPDTDNLTTSVMMQDVRPLSLTVKHLEAVEADSLCLKVLGLGLACNEPMNLCRRRTKLTELDMYEMITPPSSPDGSTSSNNTQRTTLHLLHDGASISRDSEIIQPENVPVLYGAKTNDTLPVSRSDLVTSKGSARNSNMHVIAPENPGSLCNNDIFISGANVCNDHVESNSPPTCSAQPLRATSPSGSVCLTSVLSSCRTSTPRSVASPAVENNTVTSTGTLCRTLQPLDLRSTTGSICRPQGAPVKKLICMKCNLPKANRNNASSSAKLLDLKQEPVSDDAPNAPLDSSQEASKDHTARESIDSPSHITPTKTNPITGSLQRGYDMEQGSTDILLTNTSSNSHRVGTITRKHRSHASEDRSVLCDDSAKRSDLTCTESVDEECHITAFDKTCVTETQVLCPPGTESDETSEEESRTQDAISESLSCEILSSGDESLRTTDNELSIASEMSDTPIHITGDGMMAPILDEEELAELGIDEDLELEALQYEQEYLNMELEQDMVPDNEDGEGEPLEYLDLENGEGELDEYVDLEDEDGYVYDENEDDYLLWDSYESDLSHSPLTASSVEPLEAFDVISHRTGTRDGAICDSYSDSGDTDHDGSIGEEVFDSEVDKDSESMMDSSDGITLIDNKLPDADLPTNNEDELDLHSNDNVSHSDSCPGTISFVASRREGTSSDTESSLITPDQIIAGTLLDKSSLFSSLDKCMSDSIFDPDMASLAPSNVHNVSIGSVEDSELKNDRSRAKSPDVPGDDLNVHLSGSKTKDRQKPISKEQDLGLVAGNGCTSVEDERSSVTSSRAKNEDYDSRVPNKDAKSAQYSKLSVTADDEKDSVSRHHAEYSFPVVDVPTWCTQSDIFEDADLSNETTPAIPESSDQHCKESDEEGVDSISHEKTSGSGKDKINESISDSHTNNINAINNRKSGTKDIAAMQETEGSCNHGNREKGNAGCSMAIACVELSTSNRDDKIHEEATCKETTYKCFRCGIALTSKKSWRKHIKRHFLLASSSQKGRYTPTVQVDKGENRKTKSVGIRLIIDAQSVCDKFKQGTTCTRLPRKEGIEEGPKVLIDQSDKRNTHANNRILSLSGSKEKGHIPVSKPPSDHLTNDRVVHQTLSKSYDLCNVKSSRLEMVEANGAYTHKPIRDQVPRRQSVPSTSQVARTSVRNTLSLEERTDHNATPSFEQQKNRVYSCSMKWCPRTFTSLGELCRHEKMHSSLKKLFSPSWEESIAGGDQNKCNVDSLRKKLVTKEKTHSHLKSHQHVLEFVCDCGKVFFSLGSYRKHHTVHENIKPPFKCPVTGCLKVFMWKFQLNIHMRDHTGARPYVCVVCKKSFKLKCTCINHQVVHLNDRPFACVVCKKTFKSKIALHQHKFSHGEPRFVCKDCGKKFKRKNTLRYHVRVQHNPISHTTEHRGQSNQTRSTSYFDRKFVCYVEGCFRRFICKTALINHCKVHISDYPYVCSLMGCEQRFKRKVGLQSHMKVHQRGKRYYCRICSDVKFLSSNTRLQHMLLQHPSAVTLCQIPGCCRMFTRKMSLDYHMNFYHKSGLYPCDVCSRVFKYQSTVAKHKEAKHHSNPVSQASKVSLTSAMSRAPKVSLNSTMSQAPKVSATSTLSRAPKVSPNSTVSQAPKVSATSMMSRAPNDVCSRVFKYPSTVAKHKETKHHSDTMSQAPKVSPTSTMSQAPKVSATSTVPQAPKVSATSTMSRAPKISATPTMSRAPKISATPTVSQAAKVSATSTVSQAPKVSATSTMSRAPKVSLTSTMSWAPKVSATSTMSRAPKISATSTVSQAPKVSAPSTVSQAPKLSATSTVSQAPKVSATSTMSRAPKVSATSTMSRAPKVSATSTMSQAPKVSATSAMSQAPKVSAPSTVSQAPKVSAPSTVSQAPKVSTTSTMSQAPKVSATSTVPQAPKVSATSTMSRAPKISATPTMSRAPKISATSTVSQAAKVSATSTVSQAPKVSLTSTVSRAPKVSATSAVFRAPKVSASSTLSRAPKVSATSTVSQAPKVSATSTVSQAPKVSLTSTVIEVTPDGAAEVFLSPEINTDCPVPGGVEHETPTCETRSVETHTNKPRNNSQKSHVGKDNSEKVTAICDRRYPSTEVNKINLVEQDQHRLQSKQVKGSICINRQHSTLSPQEATSSNHDRAPNLELAPKGGQSCSGKRTVLAAGYSSLRPMSKHRKQSSLLQLTKTVSESTTSSSEMGLKRVKLKQKLEKQLCHAPKTARRVVKKVAENPKLPSEPRIRNDKKATSQIETRIYSSGASRTSGKSGQGLELEHKTKRLNYAHVIRSDESTKLRREQKVTLHEYNQGSRVVSTRPYMKKPIRQVAGAVAMNKTPDKNVKRPKSLSKDHVGTRNVEDDTSRHRSSVNRSATNNSSREFHVDELPFRPKTIDEDSRSRTYYGRNTSSDKTDLDRERALHTERFSHEQPLDRPYRARDSPHRSRQNNIEQPRYEGSKEGKMKTRRKWPHYEGYNWQSQDYQERSRLDDESEWYESDRHNMKRKRATSHENNDPQYWRSRLEYPSDQDYRLRYDVASIKPKSRCYEADNNQYETNRGTEVEEGCSTSKSRNPDSRESDIFYQMEMDSPQRRWHSSSSGHIGLPEGDNSRSRYGSPRGVLNKSPRGPAYERPITVSVQQITRCQDDSLNDDRLKLEHPEERDVFFYMDKDERIYPTADQDLSQWSDQSYRPTRAHHSYYDY